MPQIVTPDCLYDIWLTDFLNIVTANNQQTAQLQNSLLTLIKNMDCDKKTDIWNTQWDCIKNDKEKLAGIFQSLLDAYGIDKLSAMFTQIWGSLTNDQLNELGNLLNGRVIPKVCNNSGLENVVTCESQEQGIKLYCLRVKISQDTTNTIKLGSDGGLLNTALTSCNADSGKVISIVNNNKDTCVSFNLSKNKDNLLEIADDGLLVVAPASKTTTVFVRTDTGTDTVVDEYGATVPRTYSDENSQFFSIENAILSTPNGGVVNVFIYYEGIYHLTADGKLLDHTFSAVDPGKFDFGNRTINIIAYGDPVQKEKQLLYEKKYRDGTMSWALAGRSRPKIMINWKLIDNGAGAKLISYRGLGGTAGTSTIQFLGVDIGIVDVQLLSVVYPEYDLTTGWLWSGSNVILKCTQWGALSTSPKHYLLGAGGSNITTYTFSYVNYFEDGENSDTILLYKPEQTTLTFAVTADTNGNGEFGDEKDAVIPSNTLGFLSRDTIFLGGIEIVNLPSPQYKDLRTNREIKFLKHPERLE